MLNSEKNKLQGQTVISKHGKIDRKTADEKFNYEVDDLGKYILQKNTAAESGK